MFTRAHPRREVVTRGTSSDLIVLLHAYGSTPAALKYVRHLVEKEFPDADIFAPALPFSLLSVEDLNRITRNLYDRLNEICGRTNGDGHGQPYRTIILVGHSLGGLLARKLYVVACGENTDAPLEQPFDGVRPASWAESVERIILLAGLNRGWALSHHLKLGRLVSWWFGIRLGNIVTWVRRRRPLILQVHRGAPFIIQLRLQTLAMARHASMKGVGGALTVQILGSVDDMVAPEDSVDLVAGKEFVYLDSPFSSHENVIDMDSTDAGRARAAVFVRALSEEPVELKRSTAHPADVPPLAERSKVTDVVFVIHGIRDYAYWTQKIARRVQALGATLGRAYETETSTYGYFPMLPFILPSRRRRKVDWLMDQYTEDLALYPDADFSFVGHSNGTYMLAKALEEYPAVRFKYVVFAGSVVRIAYPWKRMLEAGRVRAVLNYVATADWVVALFPKALQTLGLEDLGSAGHDGFAAADTHGLHQIRYVRGHHSAALREENWNRIARFIVTGNVERPAAQELSGHRAPLWFLGGLAAPLFWLLIVAALEVAVLLIWCSGWAEWQKTLAFVALGLLVWTALMRV